MAAIGSIFFRNECKGADQCDSDGPSCRVTTEYLGTQVIMSMITDSGDEYEYLQKLILILNTFEYRFDSVEPRLSISVSCPSRVSVSASFLS